MLRVLTVFGTRPEAIKIAPVIKEFQRHPQAITCKICLTAQHRQMLDPILGLFEIEPDYDLNLMQNDQSLEHTTISVLNKLGEIIHKERPDYLVVQGDTTTAMAASLAAYYKKVKIAHVEAGLRTFDKLDPYPEEMNRRLIDSVSDLFFAHTEQAKRNLLAEAVKEEHIEVTGNTVIDALLDIAARDFNPAGTVLQEIPWGERHVVLVTAHRRENFGKPLQNICRAIAEMALTYARNVFFVYPVHLNPNVQKTVVPALNNLSNVKLIEPVNYELFVHLMKKSYFILTDSGGIQEEAPSLGKPVLVLRGTTERPEAVEAGAAEVIGTDPHTITTKVRELLEDATKYQRMSQAANPYGDGKASERIVNRLLRETERDG